MSVLPSPEDKARVVAAMFGRIAWRYDLMNTLMTMGLDGGWRQATARETRLPADGRVLDVGAGTGKLSLTVAKQFPHARVIGIDFSEPMLRSGHWELPSGTASRAVPHAAGDGMRLPFPNDAFDATVSAFVVRNLADLEGGLREQARVLRPGGRLVVLEITPGPAAPLRPLFSLYFQRVVPLVGQIVAGDATAYTYLPTSSAAFVPPEEIARLLRTLDFADVTTRRLGFGTVAITSGMKPFAS